MSYCAHHHDAKSAAGCAKYKKDPALFLDDRVLRAKVNPIDAVYTCAAVVCSCRHHCGCVLPYCMQWSVGRLLARFAAWPACALLDLVAMVM